MQQKQRFRTFGIGHRNRTFRLGTAKEPLCVQIFHQLILTKGVNAADTRSENPQLDLMHLELGIDARPRRRPQKSLGSSVRFSCICYFGHELAAARRITLYCRLTLISKQGFIAKKSILQALPKRQRIT